MPVTVKTTRKGTQREKETNDILSEILERLHLIKQNVKSINDLMQEMIKVRDNSLDNHLNEETIVKSVMLEYRNDDRTAYQSPTLIIQQEVNELALQKEANKIKQKMNKDWCRSLKHRKQLFSKQVNNAKDAEQYEKWLNENTPFLPRKLRKANIRGEPEDQKNIRVNVAIERVKGENELLRLRSQNNQQKVINADKEMDDDLKRKASDRTLVILQNMWKSECGKEEKISRDIKKSGFWTT